MAYFYQYFRFSNRERKGFTVVVLILCLSLIGGLFLDWYWQGQAPAYTVLPQGEPATVGHRSAGYRALRESISTPAVGPRSGVSTPANVLFPFNPNALPEDQWLLLGLSKGQIRVIKNYESAGGKFHVKADLAKIYVIPASQYAQLEPFIALPTAAAIQDVPSIAAEGLSPRLSYALLDINRADTSEWKMLRGIGSVFARRIVNYRSLLGGFYEVDQVAEVYGLSDSVLQRLAPQLHVGDGIHHFLAINELSIDELSKHPYISKQQAQIIVNYRDEHGRFQEISDLRRIYALNDFFLRKIEPYLKFN